MLATECGISRSSVTRHLQALNAETLLSTESRRDAKGYRRSNVYRIHMEHSVNSLHRNNQHTDIQCTDLKSLSVNLTQSNVSPCYGYIIEQSLEPSKEQSSTQVVFSHWQTAMNHPQAKLDSKRKQKITQALKSYSIQDLCLAIDGCKASAWHMGVNPGKKIYDDISLIFRDAEHIERFMGSKNNNTTAYDDIFAGAI